MESFFCVWRVFWLGRVFSKVLHFGQDVLHFCYMFFVFFSEKMHFFWVGKLPWRSSGILLGYFAGPQADLRPGTPFLVGFLT